MSYPPSASSIGSSRRHDGLTDDEVRRRLEEHGENDVVRSGGRSPIDIFVAQFDSVLIWVLLAAAVLSVWAGHTVDAVLIAIIVVANGIFGFVQDYRAEQSLESLRELASPTARVRRNGEVREVDATELVPGDIVVLRGGDVVPADGRLLEATDLEGRRAALTGESVPVTKSADPVESGARPRGARAWSTRGPMSLEEGRRGRHRDGMATEVGGIARELAATEDAYALQDELNELGRTLGLGVLGLSALVAPLLSCAERPRSRPR